MFFTRSASGQILSRDGKDLNPLEVGAFVHKAMRKQLRRKGRHDRFLRTVRQFGNSSITWDFVKRVYEIDDHSVTLHGFYSKGVFRLYCLGPQAEGAVERVNELLKPSLPRWWSSSKEVAYSYKRRRRHEDWLRAKRHRLEKKRLERAAKKASQQKKVPKNSTFRASPISRERNELLTPQFRKSRIFWREAIDATVAIFEIRQTSKCSSRERAAQELWKSLERTGYRFAQYKRRGFRLRFDLIGVWRGDITPIRISCTKDNTRKEYRRMRLHFKDILLRLPPSVQDMRRDLLFGSIQQSAA